MLSGLYYNAVRSFSTTSVLCELRLLSRLRVVDNSRIGREAELSGRPAKIIHVYNKTGVGKLGDRVLVAIKGQKKKGVIVGLRQTQNRMVPRFDTNNVVLMEDDTTPTGTRIRVPIPSILREKCANFTKMLSCATKFY